MLKSFVFYVIINQKLNAERRLAMDARTQSEMSIPYDVASIVSSAKINLRNFAVRIAIYSILLVLGVLAVIFYGSHLLVFTCGVILACVSAFLCGKLIKNFALSNYSSASGEIANIHKEIKTVRTTKVGDINPFGVRKYDQDGKNEIRLGVFIKDGEKVHGYFLNDVTEDHTKYYESKGEAIHIWGTHFPVKLEIGKDQWLCPVCGEFNVSGEKTCVRCKRKVLK